MDNKTERSTEHDSTENASNGVQEELRELKRIVTELAQIVSKQDKSTSHQAKVVYGLRNEVGEMRKDLPLVKKDAERGDKLHDTESLAERWGVSERTIAKEVSEGNLEPTYIRTALRFTPEAVRAYERTATGARRRRGARKRAAVKSSS